MRTLATQSCVYHDISQDQLRNRKFGGITFATKTESNKTDAKSELTLTLIGDNRVGAVHIDNTKTDKIIFAGTGSLTAADADFITPADRTYGWDNSYYGTSKGDYGYISNHRKSAIGNDTDIEDAHAYGITFNSGVIFAGTTKIENCSAIGGGGNCLGVVEINGGVVTAVATTTGTAIGGGIGFSDVGGEGKVTIRGGSVYAYNFANRWDIPSSAIGGGGSKDRLGKLGEVSITGGYVYAYSALGSAIGGGSSGSQQGGNAVIKISGGHIIARSDSNTCIGGGSGSASTPANTPAYGGSATINISGNPVIRTGSIGGGDTKNSKGKIGHAQITIDGGDISAQFVMSGGADAKAKTTFTMNGGTISNSDVYSKEYYHVKKNGGAVYMEDGKFIMKGGTISNCSSDTGGAVYIAKSDNAVENPSFTMEGGTIRHCESKTDGGAVYLRGGSVTMKGGTIESNLAQNGNGGGLYIAAGDFSMSGDAKILYNSVLHRSASGARTDVQTGSGGGVYVTSPSGDVNVRVTSGLIQNNTCDLNGGGICVDMSATSTGDNSPKAIIQIGSADGGPTMSNNKAGMYGGGLYAIGKNAMITIDGGRIQENKVTNYVPNENVANELGTVLLNNGDVPYKTVIFNVNTTETVTISSSQQKIVTATNSALDAPVPLRENYDFVGWNLRQDGKGTYYETGDIMNLTEDITLYAQWKSQ